MGKPELKNMKSLIFLPAIVFFNLNCIRINEAKTEVDNNASKLIVDSFKQMNKSTDWRFVKAIEQNFRTYHPQGMVKIGEYFYLSSVEVIVKPEKYEAPKNGYDRSPGEGIGHLFKINPKGNLVSEIQLGEGIIYHPGGIDYDGEHIWVPVSEYRPHSNSIIYRVDPVTLESIDIFHFNDSIGGIIHNTDNRTLHGVNWGSRMFYTWELGSDFEQAKLPDKTHNETPGFSVHKNGNHYIDYQDCHYLGGRFMLCGGLNKYFIPSVGQIALGGIDLVELDSHAAIHQIPVNLRIKPDLVLTNNPFFFEMINDDVLRFYFMPEDDASKLYIYDTFNEN